MPWDRWRHSHIWERFRQSGCSVAR